jgi:hypothetical protein
MRTWHVAVAALVIGCGACAAPQRAGTDVGTDVGTEAEKLNLELFGYNDLQARSAYQPFIRQQGDRWIAYIGHHAGVQPNPLTGQEEDNGTSIVDVTDPSQPRYLAHIPGAEGQSGGAQMAQVCSGLELPRGEDGKFYLLRSLGNIGHEIWDVTDPAAPSHLTVVVSELTGTHKNWWECDTGIAYLVSGDPEWRTDRMTQIYDLSDPMEPVFIRDFGLPGQQPGATGLVPIDLHGAVSTGPQGNRLYFGYGTSQGGVIQIVDRDKLLNGPKEPTDANLLYPQVSRSDLPPDAGAHTTFPLLGMEVAEFAKQRVPAAAAGGDEGEAAAPQRAQSSRDFVAVVSETTANECLQPRQLVRLVEVTTESKPYGASTWTVPEARGNFCDRGGRFGAHASQESFHPIYYNRVLFVSHFNAGVRALDVRDPYDPQEIAYFIPAVTPNTDERCVGTGDAQRCKIAIQTNNVEVDDRGYIYIVDRANTGMHILELTGPAREVANW